MKGKNHRHLFLVILFYLDTIYYIYLDTETSACGKNPGSLLKFHMTESFFFRMFRIMEQNKMYSLLFKYTQLKPCAKYIGKIIIIKKNKKIEQVQKERCCFLDQASFEQRHGSKFNLANYIHQNCFNMYLYLHRKQKKIKLLAKTQN